MKLALLKGNRFNPWHLAAFAQLPNTGVTAFRAESEIQQHFASRGSDALPFATERIYFDTQSGPWRHLNTLAERYAGRAPKVLPFHERLQGFDLIQTWELFTGWTAQALEAKQRHGIPVSVMVWDNIPFNNEATPDLRAKKARAIREADCFLVHTERSRRMLLLEGADPHKIIRIDPGVDTQTFAPAARPEGPPQVINLLFVGWLLPRKGIDFLLAALRGLIDDPDLANTKLHLTVVGSGPGRERVDALIHRLGLGGHVHFAGALAYDAMPAYYHAADAFILPSIATDTWQEQFGMSLIEAMACGKACISTYSGAIPEILAGTGILVQPNDALALHQAIKQLIRDPGLRESLGAAARQRAEAHFALADYTANLARVYGDLLA